MAQLCEEIFRVNYNEDPIEKIDACLFRIHAVAEKLGLKIANPITVTRTQIEGGNFIRVATNLEEDDA